jgi:hypothetical protein
MRRLILGILGAALLFGGGGAATENGQTTGLRLFVPSADEITRVFTAYAAGDDRAIEPWTTQRLNFSLEALRDLETIVRRSAVTRRMRLAFVFEAFQASSTLLLGDRMLAIGRRMLEDGAKPLGVDPAEDAFEVLWLAARLLAGPAAPRSAAARGCAGH